MRSGDVDGGQWWWQDPSGQQRNKVLECEMSAAWANNSRDGMYMLAVAVRTDPLTLSTRVAHMYNRKYINIKIF